MMADLIDRQAAIDALANAIPSLTTPDGCGEFDHEIQIADEAFVDAMQTIHDMPSADVQPAQRWIPCSERLPEEDGQYLITVKYKHVNDSYEDVYAEHGDWFDGKWDMFCFEHCGEVEDIIAWMPLPEPYKDGEQDERFN